MVNVPTTSIVDPNDVECENVFQNSYNRDSSERYSVSLPFRLHDLLLGNSYAITFRRFLNLENGLFSNPTLHSHYAAKIKEYIALGHMSQVTS